MMKEKQLPEAVRLFLLVALVLDILGFTCELVGRFFHMGFPYDSPVLNESWAVDLTNYRALVAHLHSPSFFDSYGGIRYMYPAPVAPLYGLFLSFPRQVLTFEIVLVLLIAWAAIAFATYLHGTGWSIGNSVLVTVGAVLLSYPAMFELRQGNMELFLCLLVGLGVWAFARGNFHTAAALLCVAGAMKIFPFIYLGLFVANRRYKPLLTGAVAAAVVTVASLLYIDPSLSPAWHGVQNGLAAYQRELAPQYMLQTSYDHSLFAQVKILLHLAGGTRFLPASHRMMSGYLAFVAITGIALYFMRIRSLPLINQVLCLTVATILLPLISFDYTLMQLYVPWALLVVYAAKTQQLPSRGLKGVFIALAFATSIETELIFHHRPMGGLVKCFALCTLMLMGMRYPFGEEDAYTSSHSPLESTTSL